MGTPVFKVGDKVRRKENNRSGWWPHGDKAMTITCVTLLDELWLEGDPDHCWDAEYFDLVESALTASTKVKSDGGSTSYYTIPSGATELLDLIEHKKMDFATANIFKACYRLGEKEGNDLEYDINKIIFFAERLKANLKKS